MIPITDVRMTRFWITLEHAAKFVFQSIERMVGGEIFVPKIPSMKITDLANAIAPEAKIQEIGIRPGEKLHELMISVDDSRHTYEYDDRFVIYPEYPTWYMDPDSYSQETKIIRSGVLCKDGFIYSSDTNDKWLKRDELRKILETIK